jgi:hypothetical protein
VLNLDTHEIIPYRALVSCCDAILEQQSERLSGEELEALAAKRQEYSRLAAQWKRP